MIKKHIRTVRDFVVRYQRSLASWSLFVGFIIDTLTLRRIDLVSNQVILVFYLVVLGICIYLINWYQTTVRPPRMLERLYVYLPVAVQFAFGNLFSGYMVLYSRSTSLIASWPFILLLFALLLGNELFEPYYLRFKFQAAMFFFTLFSFITASLPLLTGSIGPLTFLLSALVAIGMFMGFLELISLKLPKLRKERSAVLSIIGGIITVVSLFYFTNLIPPIPLSLEDGGAYHRVEHAGDAYLVTEEQGSAPHILSRFFGNPTLHVRPDAYVYVYSSVFAPTKLKTTVVHEWQWFDETKDRWVPLSNIPFAISGGREQGYRGYTFKQYVPEGHWRVDVKTSKGQVIGRIKFNIEYVEVPPPLQTESR